MTDAEKIADVQIEVMALKGIIVSIICALANRDRELAREIVTTALKSFPKGGGNVVVLSPDLEALQVSLANTLNDLADALGRE